MRSIIGAVVVLALAGFTTAAGQEKIDGKKLIGKWEPADLAGARMVVEFADKGKVTVSVEKGGKSTKVEGTYKLDGNKLTMTMKFMEKEVKEEVKLTKLTDDEMEGENSKGMKEGFKRIKEKDKK